MEASFLSELSGKVCTEVLGGATAREWVSILLGRTSRAEGGSGYVSELSIEIEAGQWSLCRRRIVLSDSDSDFGYAGRMDRGLGEMVGKHVLGAEFKAEVGQLTVHFEDNLRLTLACRSEPSSIADNYSIRIKDVYYVVNHAGELSVKRAAGA